MNSLHSRVENIVIWISLWGHIFKHLQEEVNSVEFFEFYGNMKFKKKLQFFAPIDFIITFSAAVFQYVSQETLIDYKGRQPYSYFIHAFIE